MGLRLTSIGFLLVAIATFAWKIGSGTFQFILLAISVILWTIARSISKSRQEQEEAENAIREDARQQAAIDRIYQDEYKKHM